MQERLSKLDASATRDSPIDKEYLTVVWDVDCSVDSDGDGIKDNDADLVGTIVEYEFPRLVNSKLRQLLGMKKYSDQVVKA